MSDAYWTAMDGIKDDADFRQQDDELVVTFMDDLRAENAALWVFVRAQRDYNVAVQEHANEGGDDFFLTWRSNINVVKAQESLIKAEAAIAQYEEGESS
jgi:hypothetical protein